MAKPSTRQELIDYSLRRLGAPVLAMKDTMMVSKECISNIKLLKRI
jgi:hypothetical protein